MTMDPELVSLLARLGLLIAKVDVFFEGVQERCGAQMNCSTGCSDCCHTRLSVTIIEGALISDYVRGLEPGALAAISAQAKNALPDRCGALDASGRCSIYECRPLVCRSHGIPVRVQKEDATYRVCPLNFTEGPAEVSSNDVLDQETLSTVLGAIDAAFCDYVGRARGSRIDLTELLKDPAAFYSDEYSDSNELSDDDEAKFRN